MTMAPLVLEQLTAELRRILGESRVSSSDSIREQHTDTESYHRATPPDAVVFPETTDEVVQVVEACGKERVPIIPFGAGTSLEGHLAAVAGGVSVDLSGMNRILRVDVEDLDVSVEPGVTRKQLDSHLRPEGVFFPELTPRSAGWLRHGRLARRRCDTAECERTSSRSTS